MRFLTDPFPFQRRVLEESAARDAYGLWHDPGLGKSKQALDYATHLFDTKAITGLVVVAPNGVHRNWAVNEIPRHLPDADSFAKVLWFTKRAKTSEHRLAAEHALLSERAILLLSYDALMTPEGAAYVRRFLDRFRSLLVLDESQYVKTPGAQRTKRVLAMARYAPYRRELSGTFLANGPFDAYSQLRFLSPAAWLEAGCLSFAAFRNVFGVFERRFLAGGARHYDHLVSYKNLDLLSKTIAKWGSRLKQEDVLSDLPERTYSRRYFSLSTRARSIYEDLKRNYLVERETGGILTAPLAIVRLLRFQQITSGYLPASDLEPELMPIEERNPRLACLVETLEELRGTPTLVWAKYDRDVDLVMTAAREAGWRPVRFDGLVSEEQRAANLKAFQDDATADLFVSKASVGGVGLTLTRARAEVFYNTGWQPAEREQAERRAYRIGTKHPVVIYDIVAEGTVDETILDTLAEKGDIIARVMDGRLFSRDEAVAFLGSEG